MYWLDKLQLEQEEYARRRSEELKAAQARNAAESAEALKDFVSITDIKKRTEEVRKENAALLSGMMNEKKQYEEARDKAAADMETAHKNGSVGKYLKAKKAYDEADEALQMLVDYINTVNSKHLIEYEEYIATIADVKSEFDPEIEKAHAEMKEHLSKCREIAVKLKAQTRGVNEAIDEWQTSIYRDKSRASYRYEDEEGLLFNFVERIERIMQDL